MTGEKWEYTNWYPGEPTNTGGLEDYLCLLGPAGTWNDASDAKEQIGGNPAFGFVVEYE